MMVNEPKPARVGGGPDRRLLAAFILTLLSIGLVFPLLTPAKSNPDIVALEFARLDGKGRAKEILDIWKKDNRLEKAVANVWFDYFFIACYTITMTLSCRWAAGELRAGGVDGWAIIGDRYLAPAQVVAGASDCVENVFMLLMLWREAGDHPEAGAHPYDLLACGFALLKLVLLVLGLIYIIVGLAFAMNRLSAPPSRAGSVTDESASGI